jgi:putative FmdB family regulatory protein
MPTYQYACTECGERLEVVQSFSDDPVTECPACHGRLRKLFSAVGVVFKGSGFYKTDSRASKSSTKSSNGTSASADSGSQSSSSGDTSSSKDSASTPSSPSSGSGDGSKVA